MALQKTKIGADWLHRPLTDRSLWRLEIKSPAEANTRAQASDIAMARAP